jgi:hypothetical protein
MPASPGLIFLEFRQGFPSWLWNLFLMKERAHRPAKNGWTPPFIPNGFNQRRLTK